MNFATLLAALGALGFKKGLYGQQGSEGDKGLPGDKGEAGDKGPEGDKGLPGDKGETGDKGPDGGGGGGGGFRGVVARQNTTISITHPHLCAPSTEEIDTDGAYNPATGIFTVPAGVTAARFQMIWVTTSAIAASLALSAWDVVAGAHVAGTPMVVQSALISSGYATCTSFSTTVFPVTPGQQLRFRLNTTNTAYNAIEANSRYSVEWF